MGLDNLVAFNFITLNRKTHLSKNIYALANYSNSKFGSSEMYLHVYRLSHPKLVSFIHQRQILT